MRVSFRVNGDPVAVEVEPRLHLADCLREVLGLTGMINYHEGTFTREAPRDTDFR